MLTIFSINAIINSERGYNPDNNNYMKIGDKVEYTKPSIVEPLCMNNPERVTGIIKWIEPEDSKMPYRKVKVDNTITTADDIKIIN